MIPVPRGGCARSAPGGDRPAVFSTGVAPPRQRLWVIVGAVLAASVLSGCASTSMRDSAFSAKRPVAHHSEEVAATQHQAFRAVLATLTRHGFTIQAARMHDGLITAMGHEQDPQDPGLIDTIAATVAVTAVGPQHSRVVLATSEKEAVHQTMQSYVHQPVMRSAFSSGGLDRTVTRGSGSMPKTGFYKQFFQEVNASLKTLRASAVVLRALRAAPAIEVQSLAPVPAARLSVRTSGVPVSAPSGRCVPGAATPVAAVASSASTSAGTAVVAAPAVAAHRPAATTVSGAGGSP